MATPRIVFIDAGSVDLNDLDSTPLQKLGDYRAYSLSNSQQILKRSAGAEILIANKAVFQDALFQKLPKLRLICVAATGVNNIDLAAALTRGIAVTNVPGYSTTTVAEHALLFLLGLSHRLMEHQGASLDGRWSRSKHFAYLDAPFSDLKGKTLGIVGYGQIGREVARLAKAFGMKVLIALIPGRKKGRGRLPLKTVLAQSDFVAIHCPLTRLTHGLFNKERLAQMKRGACLLNLARGPIVDEKAVASALRSKRLAGFATDVLSAEPPAKSHPLLQKSLQGKVIVTPHIAWASKESRQNLLDEIARNIRAFKSGKKRNRIV